MKTAGIVAEFNPLHIGHEYIMDKARSMTGCDALVVALSGDYVQRGEPAILDKWTRAELALKSGADLVLEIPTLFCLDNASRYASAGVNILESLGCDMKICCGSGSGDAAGVRLAAGFIRDRRDEIESAVKSKIKTGLSYPAAREQAVTELLKAGGASDEEIARISGVLNDPNDILAIEYMMAADKAEILIAERKGAGYSADFDDKHEYQSAGAIRKMLKSEHSAESIERIAPFVPASCLDALKNSRLCFPDDFCDMLRYAVMHADAEDIEDCPSAGEGLANLIKEAALKESSWDDIIMSAKSKRYTYTRISRLCMQIVLGIRRKTHSFDAPEYIRVLGFNEKGRKLLAEIRANESSTLPVITNINKEAEKLSAEAKAMLELDVHASDVYNLCTGRDVGENSDHRRAPVIIK